MKTSLLLGFLQTSAGYVELKFVFQNPQPIRKMRLRFIRQMPETP